MFYTVYKITNKINGKIYVGIHRTENLDDDYMGSGKYIKRAVDKHGIENFEKEYLAIFDNPEDMYNMESEMVNEDFVKRTDTYNLTCGGKGSIEHLKGKVVVKDSRGNRLHVSVDNPRYISGELVPIATNCVTVRDKNDAYFRVPTDDPRYLAGELVHVTADSVIVQEGNKVYRVHNQHPDYLSGKLKSYSSQNKGVAVVDKEGNRFFVPLDDPMYLSGELVSASKGYKHTQEAKDKISAKNKIKSIGASNSQYGKCWIYRDDVNKSIKKEELDIYIADGWIRGRKNTNKKGASNSLLNTVWVHKNDKRIRVEKEELDTYIADGWVKGRYKSE
jgi:hypothetical protein